MTIELFDDDMWLSRELIFGPHVALCLTQAQFDKAISDVGFTARQPPMLQTNHAHATVHYFENSKQDLCAVVALGDTSGRAGIEIAGLLVHEAVHIWQEYHERIGEDAPSREFEAYSVQSIAQRLMWRFAELTKG